MSAGPQTGGRDTGYQRDFELELASIGTVEIASRFDDIEERRTIEVVEPNALEVEIAEGSDPIAIDGRITMLRGGRVVLADALKIDGVTIGACAGIARSFEASEGFAITERPLAISASVDASDGYFWLRESGLMFDAGIHTVAALDAVADRVFYQLQLEAIAEGDRVAGVVFKVRDLDGVFTIANVPGSHLFTLDRAIDAGSGRISVSVFGSTLERELEL